jgi:hypothetical protein
MTTLDWLELIESELAGSGPWYLFDGQIRTPDGYCPICLALGPLVDFRWRSGYLMALRQAFGMDADFSGTHVIAEAADLPNPPTLERRLVREYLMLSLGVER